MEVWRLRIAVSVLFERDDNQLTAGFRPPRTSPLSLACSRRRSEVGNRFALPLFALARRADTVGTGVLDRPSSSALKQDSRGFERYTALPHFFPLAFLLGKLSSLAMTDEGRAGDKKRPYIHNIPHRKEHHICKSQSTACPI